jgi:hypothetical protein
VAKEKARGWGKGRKRRAVNLRDTCSGEDVFYLPGKIPIQRVRELQQARKANGGGELFSRFMVRGHWRRPAVTWKEQRLRWIEPYWKGPEMAAVIEPRFRSMSGLIAERRS